MLKVLLGLPLTRRAQPCCTLWFLTGVRRSHQQLDTSAALIFSFPDRDEGSFDSM